MRDKPDAIDFNSSQRPPQPWLPDHHQEGDLERGRPTLIFLILDLS